VSQGSFSYFLKGQWAASQRRLGGTDNFDHSHWNHFSLAGHALFKM
jgi:hypothetical protein